MEPGEYQARIAHQFLEGTRRLNGAMVYIDDKVIYVKYQNNEIRYNTGEFLNSDSTQHMKSGVSGTYRRIE